MERYSKEDEERPQDASVQEGSQFELRRCEALPSTPVSLGSSPTISVSLQSIYDLLILERDVRLRSEVRMREERDQLRTVICQLRAQFEVMVG